MTTKIQLRRRLPRFIGRSEWFCVAVRICPHWPHLVLYAQQTASGCLSQQMNNWQAWTSAWTHRRDWGSAWRNKPGRTCNQTHHFHRIWLELCWWLQHKHVHKHIYFIYVWELRWLVHVQVSLRLESPSHLPRRLPKDGTIATHIRGWWNFLLSECRWMMTGFRTLSPLQSSPIFISSCFGGVVADAHCFIPNVHTGCTIIPAMFNYNVKITWSERMVDSIIPSCIPSQHTHLLDFTLGTQCKFPHAHSEWHAVVLFCLFQKTKHLAYSSAATGGG